MNINQKQKEAVLCSSGPLIILAGPGTGKTRTLTSKIEYLINEKKFKREEILALTFTVKAAEEIKNRLNLKKKPFVLTFHGLSKFILENYSRNKNLRIEIISDLFRKQIIRKIKEEFKIKDFRTKELELFIGNLKNELVLAEFQKTSFIHPAFAVKLLKAYDQRLREKQLRDFDDLLIESYKLLKTDQEYRRRLKNRFNYILVDEFQDTNLLQLNLIKLLLNQNKNICVMGDNKQAIYSFRGANQEAFKCFKEIFPETKEIDLTTNYRNPREIIEISQKLFPKAPKLSAKNRNKGKVIKVETMNEFSEADWIMEEINRLIGGIDLISAGETKNNSKDQNRFSDFCILFRLNSSAKTIKDRLRNSGIPFQVAGGDSVFEKKLIVEIIAILNLILARDPEKNFLLIEGSLFLKKEKENLKIFKELRNEIENLNPIQTVALILNKFPKLKKAFEAEKNKLDFQEFNNYLMAFEGESASIKNFLDYLEQIAKNDYYDKKADKIVVSTIHGAKGLEFKYVFVLGFNEGLIPFAKEDININEEKRLFYVALTRASRTVYLLTARERHREKVNISPFFKIIETSFIERIEDKRIQKTEEKRRKKIIKDSQTSLF